MIWSCCECPCCAVLLQHMAHSCAARLLARFAAVAEEPTSLLVSPLPPQVSNDEEGLLWEEGPNSFQPNDFILQAAVRAASQHAVDGCLGWAMPSLRITPNRPTEQSPAAAAVGAAASLQPAACVYVRTDCWGPVRFGAGVCAWLHWV